MRNPKRANMVMDALVRGETIPPSPSDSSGSTTTTESSTPPQTETPTSGGSDTAEAGASFILVPATRLTVLQPDAVTGMLHWEDASGGMGNLGIDRSQAIGLGSALLKLGNRLQRDDGLVLEEHGGLILPNAT